MSILNLDDVSPLPDSREEPQTAPAQEAPAATAANAGEAVSDPLKTLELKPRILEALSTVYDPEIPVNIYELGLIYDILVDARGKALVKMTLTAPGCPAALS